MTKEQAQRLLAMARLIYVERYIQTSCCGCGCCCGKDHSHGEQVEDELASLLREIYQDNAQNS